MYTFLITQVFGQLTAGAAPLLKRYPRGSDLPDHRNQVIACSP